MTTLTDENAASPSAAHNAIHQLITQNTALDYVGLQRSRWYTYALWQLVFLTDGDEPIWVDAEEDDRLQTARLIAFTDSHVVEVAGTRVGTGQAETTRRIWARGDVTALSAEVFANGWGEDEWDDWPVSLSITVGYSQLDSPLRVPLNGQVRGQDARLRLRRLFRGLREDLIKRGAR